MDWSSFSIGNAAGFIKRGNSYFEDILRSPATDITIGSVTFEERDGNSGQVYYSSDDGTSVNALGLPNPGLRKILIEAPGMRDATKVAGKRLWYSVAGFEPNEYREIVQDLIEYGDIELNLGCPNVWGGSNQKPIPSFNLKVIVEILKLVIQELKDGKKLRLKLSPYSDPGMILDVVKVLRVYEPFIESVVTSNTFPNGTVMEGHETTARYMKHTLDTPGGYGGVGGNAMHYIALGQVSQFVKALKETSITVIGVGGVHTGERMAAMRQCGAVGVQVGTMFGVKGAKIFSELFTDAVEYDQFF